MTSTQRKVWSIKSWNKSSHHLLALHRLLQKISSDENTSSNYSQQEELQNQFSTQLMSASLSNWETGQLTLFLLNQGISSYKHWSYREKGVKEENHETVTYFAFFTALSSQTVILLKKAKYFMKVSLTSKAGSFHCWHVTDPCTDGCCKSWSYTAPVSPLAFLPHPHNQYQHLCRLIRATSPVKNYYLAACLKDEIIAIWVRMGRSELPLKDTFSI